MIGSRVVKEIQFEYENTDFTVFPLEDIGYFYLTDISPIVSGYGRNGLRERISAHKFSVQILKDANDFLDDGYFKGWLFDKIMEDHNLCRVLLRFQDGSEERYHLDWDYDGNAYEKNFFNFHQRMKINRQGDLWISISEDQEWSGQELKDSMINDHQYQPLDG